MGPSFYAIILFYSFIFYALLLKLEGSSFDITQRQKLTLSLSQDLFIKNIVFLKQDSKFFDAKTIEFIKILSTSNISFSFLEPQELHLKIDDTVHGRIHFLKSLILSLEEKFNAEVYRLISRNENGASKFTWLVWDDASQINAKYTDFYIPYNCQLLIVNITADKNANVSYISEVYHPVINSEIIFEQDFGTWSEKKGLAIIERDVYKRRSNLNGTDFTMTQGTRIPQLWDDFLNMSSEAMNFRPLTVRIDEYEQKVKLGQSMKIAEILLFTHAYNNRNPILTSTNQALGATYKQEADLYIRQDRLVKRYAPYDQPFSKELWLTIILTIALTGTIAAFLNHVKTSIGIFCECSILDAIYHPLEAFLNQGGSQERDEKPLRITIITTRFIALFIVTSYSVFLLTYILYPNIQIPFTDLKSFVQDGSYKIAFPKQQNWEKWFQESQEPFTKLIGEKYLLDFDRMLTTTNGISQMLCYEKEKVAVIVFERHMLFPLPCKIIKIQTPIAVTWEGMDLRPGSPYKTVLNRRFKILHTAGIIDRYKKIDDFKRFLFQSFDERNKLIPVKIESI